MRIFLSLLSASFVLGVPGFCGDFRSRWNRTPDRPWPGPEYWAEPFAAWQVKDGRLESPADGPARRVVLLTRAIGGRQGSIAMSVKLGLMDAKAQSQKPGWLGFRAGQTNAGVTNDGRLFVQQPDQNSPKLPSPPSSILVKLDWSDGFLTLDVNGMRLSKALRTVDTNGEISLVCQGACWFGDWRVSGNRIDEQDERALGPIYYAAYHYDRGTLQVTAQMAPLGAVESNVVTLEAGTVRSSAKIDPKSHKATFRLEKWDASQNVPYRLSSSGQVLEGMFRKDPREKPEVVVAAVTGEHDLLFPHTDLTEHIKAQKPDFLVFTAVSFRAAEEWAARFGRVYRELLKDIPSFTVPGDVQADLGGVSFLALDGSSAQWPPGAWMHVAVSTRLSAAFATLPPDRHIRIAKPGEYFTDEAIIADKTPPMPELLRDPKVLHIAPGPRYGCTIQYESGAWALGLPAVIETNPLHWFPPQPGRNRAPEAPRYAGEFDLLSGTKITVHAVANPIDLGVDPPEVTTPAPGYGVVKFKRSSRSTEISVWPRWSDPSQPGAKPYEGWPITYQ